MSSPAPTVSGGGTPVPPFNPALPKPPQRTDTRQQEAAVTSAFSKYYWPRYFEQSPVDPASFFERLFADYANHEQDLIGDWTEDMSPVYRIYKVCLQYGTKNGTPAKAAEARNYQGVRDQSPGAAANS